jgi:hypothetical protein
MTNNPENGISSNGVNYTVYTRPLQAQLVILLHFVWIGWMRFMNEMKSETSVPH